MHAILMTVALIGLGPSDKSAESAWMHVTCRDGGFRVTMPGAPSEQPAQTSRARYGRVVYHLYTLRTSGALYYAGYAEMNNGKVDLPSSTFREIRAKLLKGVKASVTDEKTIWLNGMPGSDLSAATPAGGAVKVRTYVGRQRAYQFGYSTEKGYKSSPDLSRFLTSFKLLGK